MYKNDRSKYFLRWFWILIILFFIFGIVAGFVFPKQTISYSFNTKESFNWFLMLCIWLSGVIPASIIYAVYVHIENQEIQIDILRDLRKYMQSISAGKE